MLHSKFQGLRSIGSGRLDFQMFYHILAKWLYWSVDLCGINKFSFPPALEALYGIWLQLS